MTPPRRLQQSFGDGLIREEVSDLWELWMRQADQILEDDSLVEIVQAALSKRCRKSKTRGRPGTPADVILRLLILKHIRDWSFEETAREVRANLVYRQFTRIGAGTASERRESEYRQYPIYEPRFPDGEPASKRDPRPTWRDLLDGAARQTRAEWLNEMVLSLGWIEEAGGAQVLEQTADAVERVCQWWP